jgi:ketosteroid isomerase-like protein
MSQENVDAVRRGYEHFSATGDFQQEIFDPDFVWDMSTFPWPEQQVYPGIEGARQFMVDWLAAWDEWQIELKQLLDAGDDVVAIVRQRGRSKATGLPVDMHFARMRPSNPPGFRCRRCRRRMSRSSVPLLMHTTGAIGTRC